MLIGGLGLGFTLQRVLADPRVERAVVVEIEEPLVQWMRDGTVPHGPALLADTRATVVNADITMAIAEARSTYDLVLLDVDNGPGYLVHAHNEAVYERQFLRRCHDLLSTGRRAGRLVGERRARAARRDDARCSATPRSRPTTCCSRTGRRSTSSTWRAAGRRPDAQR